MNDEEKQEDEAGWEAISEAEAVEGKKGRGQG